MQLTPRYGGTPIIELDGPPGAIAAPTVRQRARLGEALADFTDEQWAAQSRCEAWTNRDVVLHLESTNRFFAFSIEAGRRGEPTEFLATFDPVASPVQLVEAAGDVAPAEVLARFRSSSEALADLVGSLADDDWSTPAEAPPGHLAVSAVLHHALWDSWIHERDVLLPLGIAPAVEADEVLAALRYAAALSPAFAVNSGAGRTGRLAVVVTDPEAVIVAEIGDHVLVREGDEADADGADLVLRGTGVELLEALSIRGPLGQPVPSSAEWMLRGLAEVFDVADATPGT